MSDAATNDRLNQLDFRLDSGPITDAFVSQNSGDSGRGTEPTDAQTDEAQANDAMSAGDIDGSTDAAEAIAADGAIENPADTQSPSRDMDVKLDSAAAADAAPTLQDAEPMDRVSPDAAMIDDAAIDQSDSAAIGEPNDAEMQELDSSTGLGPAIIDGGIMDANSGELDADLADRAAYPDGPYGVAVGEVIDNQSFLDSTDEPYDLQFVRSDTDTRLVVLFNTVAWCPSCVRNMVTLNASQVRLANAGVQIVVSLYDNENFMPAGSADAARWQMRNNLTMPVVADGDRSLAAYFDPFARNTYLIIDADEMRILARGQRYSSVEFNDQLDGLLEEI